MLDVVVAGPLLELRDLLAIGVGPEVRQEERRRDVGLLLHLRAQRQRVGEARGRAVERLVARVLDERQQERRRSKERRRQVVRALPAVPRVDPLDVVDPVGTAQAVLVGQVREKRDLSDPLRALDAGALAQVFDGVLRLARGRVARAPQPDLR